MHLEFPAKMYVDYVRVYQREGVKDGLTCDPPRRPTAQYIKEYVLTRQYLWFTMLTPNFAVIQRHTETLIGQHGLKQDTSFPETQNMMAASPVSAHPNHFMPFCHDPSSSPLLSASKLLRSWIPKPDYYRNYGSRMRPAAISPNPTLPPSFRSAEAWVHSLNPSIPQPHFLFFFKD